MDTALFFDQYFNNAEVNSIMILDKNSIILDLNSSFTKNFGYSAEQLVGQNFSVLFTESDRHANLPQRELEEVVRTGQASSESFMMNSDTVPTWCVGESLRIKLETGEIYIVRDVVNLQVKKQMQVLFTETDQLLELVFETTKDIPMLLLNKGLKIEKANKPFAALFELDHMPASGSRLAALNHPFWSSEEIRQELARIIIAHRPINKMFRLETGGGEPRFLRLKSKLIEPTQDTGAKIFLLIEEVRKN